MHVMMTVNAAWNVWNFRLPVLKALMNDGHRITVLAPPDDSVVELERLGASFKPLEMNVKGLNPIENLKLVRRFKRTFGTERPDIVLSYTIKNNIFGAMAAKPLGIPFLPNVSGLGTAFLSGGLLQFVAEGLYRRAFANLPVVFFQNTDDRDLFLKQNLIQPNQAQLLPGSGIDLQRFTKTALPADVETPIFLMIARLLRDKGVVEFVDAARQVKASCQSARFQLLGAADSENRSAFSSATIQSWVNEGVIEYLGTTSDVRPAIAAASCVVLPSYREGAPRTLIEAAAMGRPLITTDVPGCRTVVDDNISGFLCEVRNADSLARAIRRFLELDPIERQAMGEAGRTKMERDFDQAIVIREYNRAIESITGKREDGSP